MSIYIFYGFHQPNYAGAFDDRQRTSYARPCIVFIIVLRSETINIRLWFWSLTVVSYKFFKAEAVLIDKRCSILTHIAVVPGLIPAGYALFIGGIALNKAILGAVRIKPLKECLIHFRVVIEVILLVRYIYAETSLMVAGTGLCDQLRGDLTRFLVAVSPITGQL